MSNRKTDWSPWFQGKRDESYLMLAVQNILAIHDGGNRVPESSWDILREAYARARGQASQQRTG